MKLTKIDKRMIGAEYFTHAVIFDKNKTSLFVEARRWCVSQWGDSLEYDIWREFRSLRNLNWCWERTEGARYYRCRIMFKDEQLASWFLVKFG